MWNQGLAVGTLTKRYPRTIESGKMAPKEGVNLGRLLKLYFGSQGQKSFFSIWFYIVH